MQQGEDREGKRAGEEAKRIMTDVIISDRDVMERCTLRIVFRPRRSFPCRIAIASALMRITAMVLGCNVDVSVQFDAADGSP